MAELQVAVVGCGGIGRTHLERWAEVSGAAVAAVCDTDGALAAPAAADFGADAHTDYRAMLRGSAFDVVDICTPPASHAPVAIAAFSAGAHVLCEKPLARTPDEARRMIEAAESRERLLMTAFCHRFHPPVLFLKELIENDDLGRVTMFRSRFSGSLRDAGSRWFSDLEVSGGGVLMDTAVHSIDLFRYLAGEVTEVSGATATFNPALSVEDTGVLWLRSEGGALGVVEASWSTPAPRSLLEVYGTAGSCVLDYDTGRVTFRTADMPVWETREVGGPDRFQREILHFCDAVRGLQPLLVTGRDGLRALEIVADVYGQTRPRR